MVVCNEKNFLDSCRGSSMLEVLLAMAIVAMATPFFYSQISETSDTLRDMVEARKIISLRDDVLNFVRLNQSTWPDVAQIKLSDEELDEISELPDTGFIDKYSVKGATVTDVYLSFDLDKTNLRASRIAKNIGMDAAVVGPDGIAYGDTWAVAAPDFKEGNLIYRISRDIEGEDKSKYLHRTATETEKLNMMMRDLNMGSKNVFKVGGITAKSAEIKNLSTSFIDTGSILSDTIYFSSGASLYGDTAYFGNLRVTGDMSGFRNIYAKTLNGDKYTTRGRIITDRATVNKSVNIANNLTLKSDTTRTISAFTGITTHSVNTSYISTEEIIFYENFGLTISGELLMSTTAPIKIGSWTFPSLTPPRFSSLKLGRAEKPSAPSKAAFSVILSKGWQSAKPKEMQ